MSEKYTPSLGEIIKAKGRQTAGEREPLAEEPYEPRQLGEVKRMLQAMEKTSDDAFLYVNYQYKYRPQETEELMPKEEAIVFLKRYSEGDDMGIYHGFHHIEIFSAKQARRYEERKAVESRQAQEEFKREKAEEAARERIDRLRIMPTGEIAVVVDPQLESENSLGISKAIGFVDLLKKSVEEPAEYLSVKDRSKASGKDKITHEGWKEHDDLKHAFQLAVKIESHVNPYMKTKGKKNYEVEVRFTDKEGKEIMTISTVFDDDGKQSGGISMSMP